MQPSSPKSAATLAFVLVAVAAAFLPALDAGFFWDDEAYVLRNDAIQTLDAPSWHRILTGSFEGHYHPVTLLSLALDYRLFGLRPAGYHAVNLALHLLNVALCFFLVRRLSGSPAAAWAAALLWGIHPLRVESVTWIASRKDLLYAAFYLAGLLAYLSWQHRGGRWRYAAVAASFAASALSKAMAVSFPLALVLVDFLEGRGRDRRAWLAKAPFFAASAALGVIAFRTIVTSGASMVDVERPLWAKAVFGAWALAVYAGKTAWPAGLCVYYPMPPASAPIPPAAWAGAALALAGAAAVLAARRVPGVVFGAGFFLAGTIFVLRPIGGAVLAERYTYVAGIGLAYLAGTGYAALRGGRWGPAAARAALPAVLAVAAALGGATWLRGALWKDPAAMWNDVIAKEPSAWIGWQNRGILRAASGDRAGAVLDFDRALAIRPDPVSYHARANERARLGDREGAARDYAEAVRLDPSYGEAWYNKGWFEMQSGDARAALASFDRAVEVEPGLVPAWLHRGEALLRLGRAAESRESFSRALAIDPGFAPALQGRAAAALVLGDRAAAAADLREAERLGLAVDPRLVRAAAGEPVTPR